MLFKPFPGIKSHDQVCFTCHFLQDKIKSVEQLKHEKVTPMDNEMDMISFGIIANSGDARSFAFQALNAAKEGRFDEADELLKKSDEASAKAHKAQTDLLFAEMNGQKKPIDLLMVHSQDHLMTSMLASELIREMIDLYKNKEDKKD